MAENKHTNNEQKWNFWTPIMLVGVLTAAFLAHASYIYNGFVWNSHIDYDAGLGVMRLSEIWRSLAVPFGATGFFRPMVTLVNSIDAAAYGNWAAGFHLTNIILHVIATGLVFVFVRKFFNITQAESLLVALMFGVHPLSWVPVGFVSQRTDILAIIFILSAVALHISFRERGRIKFALGSVFLSFLAYLSKESAVVLVPALIILWEFLNPRRKSFLSLRARLYFIGMGAALAVYMFLRVRALPELWRIKAFPLSPPDWLGTRLLALGNRLVQLLSPHLPNLSDTIAVTGVFSPAPIIILAVSLGFAYYALRKKAAALERSAILMLGIMLAQALNIVPLPRFNAPHLAYFAVIPWGVVLIAIYKKLRLCRKALLYPFLFVFILWFAVAIYSTFRGGARFLNDKTLFEPEVARDQNYREGHFYLAQYYWNAGDVRKASEHYEAAMPRNPKIISYVDEGALYLNFAGVRAAQGFYDDAEKILREARSLGVANPLLISYNEAVLADKNGDYGRVVEILRPVYAKLPIQDAPLLLIRAHLMLKDAGGAEEVLRGSNIISKEKRRDVQTLIDEIRDAGK